MTTAIAFCESDIDPFDEEFLADPLPRLAQLRDLGPVVYLSRYDAHAVARYADVHRALTDWQSLQSGAGVGLSIFNHEEPWRPPSLLLEADPPRHDAPRHVLQQILSPRRLRALSDRWRSNAEQVVDDVLGRGDEFDAVTEIADVFPSGSSPMPSVSHAQAPLMVRSLLTAGVDTTVTGIAAEHLARV
ncbi:cytochrome P450 family protein [Nostocoides australiense]